VSSNANRLPSIPGRPIAMLNRGIYVTVKWTRPEDNDEAADVNGYVIKYHDSTLSNTGFCFDRATLNRAANIEDDGEVHVDGIETSFQFTHQLKQRTYYQFAVAAKNSVGRGEFSKFSNNVMTWNGK